MSPQYSFFFLHVYPQDDVQQLSDTEKLLLYLRLPGESLGDTKDDLEQ